MDGDARRPTAPQAKADYTVHVGYELPQPGLDASPGRHREQDDKSDADAPKKGEAKGADSEPGGAANAKKKPPMSRGKKILYWAIGLAVLAVLVVAGVLFWLHARQFVSTDDAFVDGHISQVSSEVAGRVTKVAIEDYQHVKAGQVLVVIDPRNYQVKLEQARAQQLQVAAQVQQARAGLANQQAAVDQARSNVRVTQADQTRAVSDLNRYRSVDPRAVARVQVDTASSTAKAGQARVEAGQQAVTAAEANVSVQRAQIEAALANLKAADVAVSNAELQLSYTNVVAPRDGQIAKRTVELGNYINPGQALLAVVGEERWITANFKETELAGMKPGQSVAIGVDACPDHGIDGTVESTQPGSGSVFSSLPAENATGNYVKVVQRVPVRIRIKDEDAVRCRIAPGMSATPSVRIR